MFTIVHQCTTSSVCSPLFTREQHPVYVHHCSPVYNIQCMFTIVHQCTTSSVCSPLFTIQCMFTIVQHPVYVHHCSPVYNIQCMFTIVHQCTTSLSVSPMFWHGSVLATTVPDYVYAIRANIVFYFIVEILNYVNTMSVIHQLCIMYYK